MVFVRQIVDEHSGVINLESKVGRSTTVSMRCLCASPRPRGSQKLHLRKSRPGPTKANQGED